MNGYRSVLEVLKYANAEETLREWNAVSQLWAKVSRCDELWDQNAETYQQAPRSKTEAAYESFRRFSLYHSSIPDFHPSDLVFKNCHTSIALRISLSKPRPLPFGYFLTLLSDFDVMVTGGTDLNGDPVKWTMTFGKNGDREIAQMVEGRCRHAAVVVRKVVYVMGGLLAAPVRAMDSLPTTRPSSHCEGLYFTHLSSLESSYWVPTPSMLHPRSHFTLSPHWLQVFICGGRGVSSCELFDTVAMAFSLLPYSIPIAEYSFSALVGRSLTVFGNDSLTKISLETGKTEVRPYPRAIIWYHFGVFSASNVVVLGDFVFKGGGTGVLRYDLKTDTVSDVPLNDTAWVRPDEHEQLGIMDFMMD